MRGVVAAGHPLSAEAGADALRAGGNAVDAAVAAVLMSFVAESPLTGPGAGGFMVVHAGGESHVLDFFVAAPGIGVEKREPAELVPIDVRFSEDAIQRFNIGPASCGAYGTTLGLAETLRRFGTVSLGELTRAPARAAREGDEEFLEGLATEGFLEQFLAKQALDTVATEVRSRLGNTTHISVMDADGACASVTCSNGSCSGVVVPGTGMHLNNMLGEHDLNPLGFHRHPPGARVPSMMAPTVVLSDGAPEIALGSAGSNRIRSAILQTVLHGIDDAMPAQDAV